jgi:hypothetical protein
MMRNIVNGWGTVPRWAVVFLALLVSTSAPVAAQTTYTWTGAGSNTDWFTAANWSPNGSPGTTGQTENLDVALFDTAGTTVSTTNPINGDFNLGAIATVGASGGLMTVHFEGNTVFRLNGGYTVGSFTNVAAAAQNGRDLFLELQNFQFGFGTMGNPTTFYADAGRSLVISVQQLQNFGSSVNKEGAGILIVGSGAHPPTTTRDLGTGTLNINGGTFAAPQNLNVGSINVAAGASLQPGLDVGGTLGANANITFQSGGGLRILTNGSSVNQLQNASLTKGTNDTFVVTLAGLNPSGSETFNYSNAILYQGGTLTGFAPNGTYSPSNPGDFSVVGDGFIVTNWNLSVVNNNQLRLDSVTVTPVPEPATALALGAFGLAAIRLTRRRSKSVMEAAGTR